MAESFVTKARGVYRREDYNRNPVGKVTAVNADGTFSVITRTKGGSLITVNLVNTSPSLLYVGAVVNLQRRTKNGTMEITGRSSYRWKETTWYYG